MVQCSVDVLLTSSFEDLPRSLGPIGECESYDFIVAREFDAV